MGVSCDICKYGCEHDYVRNNYYCSNNNSCHPIADSPIVKNCRCGEIDQWKYDFKYKPNKSDKNVLLWKKLMNYKIKLHHTENHINVKLVRLKSVMYMH